LFCKDKRLKRAYPHGTDQYISYSSFLSAAMEKLRKIVTDKTE